MKKSKKNLEEETQKISSKMCDYHEGEECHMNKQCEHCLRSQMSKEEYDEFIGGIAVPPGV